MQTGMVSHGMWSEEKESEMTKKERKSKNYKPPKLSDAFLDAVSNVDTFNEAVPAKPPDDKDTANES